MQDGNGKEISRGFSANLPKSLNGKKYVSFTYTNADKSIVTSDAVGLCFYYAVKDVDGWYAISEDLDAGYALTADIDFSSVNFENNFVSVARTVDTGAEVSSVYFNGILDGNGFAIKNVDDTLKTIETNSVYVYAQGLFGAVGTNGVIKNLTLENVSIFSRNHTGLIAGENKGTICDIKLKNCVIYNMYGAGALVAATNSGIVNRVVMENCAHRTGSSAPTKQYLVVSDNTASGVIANVAATGTVFYSGKTGLNELTDAGQICKDDAGTVYNVNGVSDTTIYPGNVNFVNVDFEKDIGCPTTIWSFTDNSAVIREGTLNSGLNSVDLSLWTVRNAVWGYTDVQTHGGVIAENVTYDTDGNLVLIANGDYYAGDKKGINSSYSNVYGGKRTGGVIRSRDSYGPGSFETEMIIPAFNGICTSMWLFNYVDYNDASKPNANYEIDIELHGTAVKNGVKRNDGNLDSILCTNWITELDSGHKSKYIDANYSLNDGLFHKYRFDWHTGNDPRVEYYLDGKLVHISRECVPDNEMYLNIGCWFPNNWCGEPLFETDILTVKSFEYKPFANESASAVNCGTHTAGSGERFDPTVKMPFKNLIANGLFEYFVDEKTGWNTKSAANGSYLGNAYSFQGTLYQYVETDCGNKPYVLTVAAAGSGIVNVYYESLVTGVAVTGSLTRTLQPDASTTIEFTPPDNCTRLKIEFVSEMGLTLKEVILLLKTV